MCAVNITEPATLELSGPPLQGASHARRTVTLSSTAIEGVHQCLFQGYGPFVKPSSGPETSRFGEFLGRIGRALDARVTEPPPDALTVRHAWADLENSELPDVGVGADPVVDQLVEKLIPHGARMTDPAFWMFITAGPSTVPVVAATAALVAGTQRQTIHAFHALEETSLRWLAQLVGLPAHMRGVYSSGGSTANLVALGAARQHAFESRGIDPAERGFDGTTSVVYASTEAHHTIQRSMAVLGMGRQNVRLIPVDERQHMVPEALAEAMDADLRAGLIPIAVVANAGTTNTGAIDPLRRIGDITHARDTWFHVDGAYGLPGILDERVAERYDGLELADSAIVDPHKWLNAPVGVAATFVRDRSILQRAFAQGAADYLEGSFATEDDDLVVSVDAMGIPYADFGVELSATSRGVQVWALIREQGRSGIAERMRRDNDFAQYVADRARADERLENLTDPELSIACVRYIGNGQVADLDELNERIYRRLLRESPYLPSTTVVNGCLAIRPCFINPRTTWSMVEDFVDVLLQIGAQEAAA